MNIPKRLYILTTIQSGLLTSKLYGLGSDPDGEYLIKLITDQKAAGGRYLLTDEEADRIIERLDLFRGDAAAKSLQEILFSQQQYNPADEAHHEVLKNNI